VPGVEIIELNTLPVAEKAGIAIILWILMVSILASCTIFSQRIKRCLGCCKENKIIDPNADEYDEFDN
jgi:hypothetical protein